MNGNVQIDGPWRDSDLSPADRAESLLGVLSREVKLQVAVGNLQPLAGHGVPELYSHDGPNGIALPGATVFPSGYSLASTFDVDLARRFGRAVAEELRAEGKSVWLGPSVDIARAPLGGRQVESFGEDPLHSGEMARAAVEGARSQHTIATLKHFVANNQEAGRTGAVEDDGRRTPGMDVQVSARALREIYVAPFLPSLRPGGAGAVMGSYNRVNGLQACENPDVIALIKEGWPGVFVPDYQDAVRDQVGAARAGVDLPQFDQGSGGRDVSVLEDERVDDDRLDDIVRRTLWMIFDSGLFDDPVGPPQPPSGSAHHRRLAHEIARRGMVVLRNEGLLPLPRTGSIAVIGPAEDAVFTTGGSAGTDLAGVSASTPRAGIAAAADPATVVFVHGSRGDAPATTHPPFQHLRTAGGSEGWDVEYWDGGRREGTPVLLRVEPRIDLPGPPAEVAGGRYSARWSTTLTPTETGMHHFTSLHAGEVSLRIGGREVLAGSREATRFARGPLLPIAGSIRLQADVPVEVVFEYSSRTALFAPSVTLRWQPPSESGIVEAVEVARSADVAIVVVNAVAGEGADRTSLSLPGDQDDLVSAVAAVNPRTIVVVNAGGPVLMPWVSEVAAVVSAWYPGETFGTALAALLFGDEEPAGRLPVTFPRTEEETVTGAGGARRYPGIDGVQAYDEGILVGYRWHAAHDVAPLFPFGHGLSYTDFRYTDFSVDGQDGDAWASVLVHNVGPRAGTAVLQAYVTRPERDDVLFPPNALVGFVSVDLPAGGSKEVRVLVPRRCLSFWDENVEGWVEELEGRALWLGTSAIAAVTGPVSLQEVFR